MPIRALKKKTASGSNPGSATICMAPGKTSLTQFPPLLNGENKHHLHCRDLLTIKWANRAYKLLGTAS